MLLRFVLAAAMAAMLSLGSFSAYAQTKEQRDACGNDAQNYCPDDIPDKEKVYNCLVRNVSQLTPACKKLVMGSPAPTPARSRR
jgi:hypothetical protein